jgi:hypothetical protein
VIIVSSDAAAKVSERIRFSLAKARSMADPPLGKDDRDHVSDK